MKMKISRLLLLALMTFMIVSCDDKLSEDNINLDEMFSADTSDDESQDTDPMKVVGVKFSPDYKTFRLFTTVVRGMGPYSFTDTSRVYVKGYEVISGIENTSSGRPRLVDIINSEGIFSLSFKFRYSIVEFSETGFNILHLCFQICYKSFISNRPISCILSSF